MVTLTKEHRMKPIIGLISTSFLLLVFGIAIPACAQQEQKQEERSLSVLPPEGPQVLPSGLDVRFLQPRVVANLIPLVRSVEIAGIDTNASHLVRDLPLLKDVLHAAVEVENLLFVLNGFLAIPLKSV